MNTNTYQRIKDAINGIDDDVYCVMCFESHYYVGDVNIDSEEKTLTLEIYKKNSEYQKTGTCEWVDGVTIINEDTINSFKSYDDIMYKAFEVFYDYIKESEEQKNE